MPLPKTLCSALLEAQGEPWGGSSMEKNTPQLRLPVYPSPPASGGIRSPHRQRLPPAPPAAERGFIAGDEDSCATNPVSLQKKTPMQSAGRSICEDGLILTIERCRVSSSAHVEKHLTQIITARETPLSRRRGETEERHAKKRVTNEKRLLTVRYLKLGARALNGAEECSPPHPAPLAGSRAACMLAERSKWH